MRYNYKCSQLNNIDLTVKFRHYNIKKNFNINNIILNFGEVGVKTDISDNFENSELILNNMINIFMQDYSIPYISYNAFDKKKYTKLFKKKLKVKPKKYFVYSFNIVLTNNFSINKFFSDNYYYNICILNVNNDKLKLEKKIIANTSNLEFEAYNFASNKILFFEDEVFRNLIIKTKLQATSSLLKNNTNFYLKNHIIFDGYK